MGSAWRRPGRAHARIVHAIALFRAAWVAHAKRDQLLESIHSQAARVDEVFTNTSSIDQQLETLELRKDDMLKQLRGLDDALAAVHQEEGKIQEEIDHLEKRVAILGRVNHKSEELMQQAKAGLKVIERNYTTNTEEAEKILACLEGRCGEAGDLPKEDTLESLWQEVHAKVKEARRVEAALEGPDSATETTSATPSTTEEGMFGWFQHQVLGLGAEESKTASGSTAVSEPSTETTLRATTTLIHVTTSAIAEAVSSTQDPERIHHRHSGHHGAAGHHYKLTADESVDAPTDQPEPPHRNAASDEDHPSPAHAPPVENAQCSSFVGSWDDGKGGTVEITQQPDCTGTLFEAAGQTEDVEMIGNFIEFASKPLSGELRKDGTEIVWTDEEGGVERPAMVYYKQGAAPHHRPHAPVISTQPPTLANTTQLPTSAASTETSMPASTTEMPASASTMTPAGTTEASMMASPTEAPAPDSTTEMSMTESPTEAPTPAPTEIQADETESPTPAEACVDVQYSWKSVRPIGSFCLPRSAPIVDLLTKVCEEQLGPYGSYDMAKCSSQPFIRCQGLRSDGRWYSAGEQESEQATVDEELQDARGGHFTCENFVRLWGRDT